MARVAPLCGPLTLPPNKHPYLFSLGRIAAEATGPCRREISTYWWRLSPGQGLGVKTGGGGGAADQRSGLETGSLRGSVWAPTAEQAAPGLIERTWPSSTRLPSHQLAIQCSELADWRHTKVPHLLCSLFNSISGNLACLF